MTERKETVSQPKRRPLVLLLIASLSIGGCASLQAVNLAISDVPELRINAPTDRVEQVTKEVFAKNGYLIEPRPYRNILVLRRPSEPPQYHYEIELFENGNITLLRMLYINTEPVWPATLAASSGQFIGSVPGDARKLLRRIKTISEQIE